MDCNKEEAIRAKVMAEKKMQNKDFVGARKIALKAQQLFPELENISQMLTVCDVHCSAEHKILGSETDWYGILQVERTAEEALIKKQYRKLALLLHPDKNKFAGAEAAFKLIGEAQMVLLDQSKRSLYDMKHRASLRTPGPKPPSQQANGNSYVRRPPVPQNNFVNISTSWYTGLKSQQQQTRAQFSNNKLTFWTSCPFCSIRYQYYRELVNRSLRCQNCGKTFIAYDLEAQGWPHGGNIGRPVFPQQQEVQSQGAHKVGSESAVGNAPSTVRFDGRFGSGTMPSESFTKTRSSSEIGLTNDKGKRAIVEEEQSRTTSRKKRTSVLEPCESSDSAISSDTEEDVVMEEDGDKSVGQNLEDLQPRRSTRQKRHVSYKENLSDDDDVASHPPMSRGMGSCSAAEVKSDNVSMNGGGSEMDGPGGSFSILEEDGKKLKQKGKVPFEESLPNRTEILKKWEEHGEEASPVDDFRERSEIHNNSDINSSLHTTPDPEFYQCPDPDFSDFEKEREEECFEAEQIWALYDSVDGMPRFYARIRKLLAPGFKLRITWLEPDLDDQDEIDWFNEELPVSCGKFKHGSTENTEDRLMFSHLVCWEKGRTRGSYKIYPRKGETWALFKNWDIKWKSDPDNHRRYEYEFVEVLSEYAEGLGITVTYLDRLEGFVSLFQRTIKRELTSVQISPTEMLRFSHRVPCFRMTGKERQDVPEGSYELDPAASLPANTKEFPHNDDAKVDK